MEITPIMAIICYLDTVGSLVHSMHTDRWVGIRQQKQFELLYPFLESVFAIPATSAPVECVFSHSGIYMRPHRARLSDKVLSDMVYIKCNSHLSAGPILSVFSALIVHSELKSAHPGFPVAFIF